MVSCQGEGPGGWPPGLEKDFIPFWELLVFVVRKKMGRDTEYQHSELCDIPSWGCRVVGTGGIPQPQQPEGLRNQAPRIAPEKQLWARAPERNKKRLKEQGRRLAWQSHLLPGPGRLEPKMENSTSWLEAKNSTMRQSVRRGSED